MTPSATSSSVCAIVQASLEPYLRDALPAPQRKMLRDHLAACAECRGAAVLSDPTFRFARSVSDEVGAEERREILAAVRTGVELREAERRIGTRPSPSRRLRIGSAAAAAVALVAVLAPGWRGVRTRVVPQSAAEATAAPASSTSLAAVPDRGLSPAASAGLAEGAVGSVAMPSDATVYDWNPGAGPEEPRVVWIVDRGLDI